MLILIGLLVISSITLIAMVIIPLLETRLGDWQAKKEKAVEKELDKLFYDKNPDKIVRLYYILPPLLGLIGYLLGRSFWFAAGGALLGLLVPNFILKIRDGQRRIKFSNQILDSIMILSSSLKGGLSLLQAFEVLVEEMPAPMNQEMGLVIRENKMGVTLEESLKHLDKRMAMEELSLVINSLLVARETGGDLTKVLSRLCVTIRDNRKLKDQIRTLTLQGRMQGVIMSGLPLVFVWWVITFNRAHFDIMLKNDLGRMLLIVAVALQIIGMILIRKFSIIRI
jgi:tight adherence protein B